jgi:hypothetical protein
MVASAPSGAGVVEVVDEPTADATEVAGVARVVEGEMLDTLVVVVVDTVGAVDVVDVGALPPNGGFHPRMVVPAHVSESTLLRRPHSLWSMDIPQRAFTEIQLAV